MSQLIQYAKTPASTDLNHRPIGRGHLQQSHGKELPQIPGSGTIQKVVKFQSVSMSLEEQATANLANLVYNPEWMLIALKAENCLDYNSKLGGLNKFPLGASSSKSFMASILNGPSLGTRSSRSIQRDKEVSIFNLLNDSKNNQSIYVNIPQHNFQEEQHKQHTHPPKHRNNRNSLFLSRLIGYIWYGTHCYRGLATPN